jgi:hypothetical protein
MLENKPRINDELFKSKPKEEDPESKFDKTEP